MAMRHLWRMGRAIGAGLVAVAIASMAPAPVKAFDIEIIWVHPSGLVTLEEGESQLFQAFIGTVSSPTFLADFGPDGVPGTDDDDFAPVSVEWELSGPPGADLGTLSATTGESTTFTAPALPEETNLASVSVLARFDGMLGGTGVMIVPATEPPPPSQGRLAFLDGFEDETVELVQLRMDPVHAMFLASLTAEIARREAKGREVTDAELRLLRQLVSSDFRHRVVARDVPGDDAGKATIATVASYDPDGELIDEVDVVLEPMGGGELAMLQQIAFVHPDTRSPRLPGRRGAEFHFDIPGEADGLLFLTAVVGGRVVATAPNLTDAEGTVISGGL